MERLKPIFYVLLFTLTVSCGSEQSSSTQAAKPEGFVNDEISNRIVSTDDGGAGISGAPMIAGDSLPSGFYANFNLDPKLSPPVDPIVQLLSFFDYLVAEGQLIGFRSRIIRRLIESSGNLEEGCLTNSATRNLSLALRISSRNQSRRNLFGSEAAAVLTASLQNVLDTYAASSCSPIPPTIPPSIPPASVDDFLNDTTGNWTIYVLDASADIVGQCSAFTFGDISDPNGACTYLPDSNNINQVGPGGFEDNVVVGAPPLAGGDGVLGNDRIAGTIGIIKTGRNSFDITSFQVDPYLGTAGGVFKTTMTTMGFAGASGTVADVTGDMSLDLTGRTGITEFFVMSLGEQPWNLDTHGTAQTFCTPGTGVYELLTSGTDTAISCADGSPLFTVTGRPLGDADDGFGRPGSDGVLDAVLVSAGNVGDFWQFFDGTPYSEAFNIRVCPATADSNECPGGTRENFVVLREIFKISVP